ncbi:hypothetical protein GYMLUDRAFT_146703, partial [Collybiopsis luxurians FD-317 M1]
LRTVPVPIGPALPRRDREIVYERYSRLMLIFFKPWRSPSDLREDNQSWSQAFEAFIKTQCDVQTRKIINNMQLLHECRDSRDDH